MKDPLFLRTHGIIEIHGDQMLSPESGQYTFTSAAFLAEIGDMLASPIRC
jgi:hypothetical protein